MKGGERIITDSKYRAAPDFAMTHKEDNDTPIQSQSERDKTVADNEGGSVRPTVGVKLPWRQFAAERLATSRSVSGCRGQIRNIPIISSRMQATYGNRALFYALPTLNISAKYIGTFDRRLMLSVDNALAISIGISKKDYPLCYIVQTLMNTL